MPSTASVATPYIDEPLDPEDFEIAVQVLRMTGEARGGLPPPPAHPAVQPFPSPFDNDAA